MLEMGRNHDLKWKENATIGIKRKKNFNTERQAEEICDL